MRDQERRCGRCSRLAKTIASCDILSPVPSEANPANHCEADANPANRGEANPGRDVGKGNQKRAPPKYLGANTRLELTCSQRTFSSNRISRESSVRSNSVQEKKKNLVISTNQSQLHLEHGIFLIF